MSSRETSVEPSSSDMRKIVQFNEYLLLDENSIQLSLGIGMQPEYESKKLKAIDDDLLLRLKDIIMYEILTRVPLDSLMQWMCVCKEWSSLIISPSFGSMHSRRNTSKNPGLIFYSTRDATRDVNRDDFDYYEGTPHLVLFDINKKVERAIQLPPEIEDDCRGKVVTVLHSLNGLVLISCSSHDMSSKMVSDYVLNPITGYYTTLPVPDMDDMETGCGKDNYLILVYDSVASKYKVIYCGYAKEDYFCKISDISVGAAGRSFSWRDVAIPKSWWHLRRENPPIVTNGYLHCMFGGVRDIRNLNGNYSSGPTETNRQILRLDVHTEHIDKIGYPGCYSGRGSYTLLEMRGVLCYIHHVSDLQLKFLVLKKDSNNKYEWVEDCNVDLGHLRNVVPFVGFLSDCKPSAILSTDTERKLIFWYLRKDYEDEDDYLYRYYSYDVDRCHLELIYEPLESNAVDFHVNTLAYF